MYGMPSFRDHLVSGLDFDALIDKAKEAATTAQDQAKKELSGGSIDITKQLEDAAEKAAKAHAETLVDEGGKRVDATWDKAKPWVIGGVAALALGVGVLIYRTKR